MKKFTKTSNCICIAMKILRGKILILSISKLFAKFLGTQKDILEESVSKFGTQKVGFLRQGNRML